MFVPSPRQARRRSRASSVGHGLTFERYTANGIAWCSPPSGRVCNKAGCSVHTWKQATLSKSGKAALHLQVDLGFRAIECAGADHDIVEGAPGGCLLDGYREYGLVRQAGAVCGRRPPVHLQVSAKRYRYWRHPALCRGGRASCCLRHCRTVFLSAGRTSQHASACGQPHQKRAGPARHQTAPVR
jgi:hypothetical protein